MRKKGTAGERILESMKQITKWAEGDESAARLTPSPSIDSRKDTGTCPRGGKQ